MIALEAFILAALCIFLYAPALSGEWVFDDLAIRNNGKVMTGDWRACAAMPWRPLTWLSYALTVKLVAPRS